MQNRQIEGFRLSPQQHHLWELLQSDTNGPFVSQCAVKIDGELRLDQLETALQRVVLKYEILRTGFHRLPEMAAPIQVVADHCRTRIIEQDICDLDVDEQKTRIEKSFEAMHLNPLPSAENLLIEIHLFVLGPKNCVMLIVLPAICVDWKGMRSLVEELASCYANPLNGSTSSAGQLQYADLAEWQNRVLEAKETKPGRDYWTNQDIESLLSLQLPFE